MARSGKFQVSRTGSRDLDAIQQAAADTFAQLEEARRGLVVGPVASTAGSLQLGEQLVAIYRGPGGHRFTLPPADAQGTRSQLLCVSNAGSGNLDVAATGADLVNGAAALVLAAGASAILFSDGAAAWRAVV